MDRIAFMKSVNFEFLRPGNELLANLAGLAEAVLHIDPGSALTRLRSFAEELTKAIYKEELLRPNQLRRGQSLALRAGTVPWRQP